MLGHKDPEAMARVLVSYIACDRKVRSAILTEFNSAPGLPSIADIRARHEAEVRRFKRGRIGDSNYAASSWLTERHQIERDMEIASAVFVRSIMQERGARA